MDERRLDLAMNRIDAALARIEKAASNQAAGQPRQGPRDEELRSRVGSALAELDVLIQSLER